MKHRGLGKDAFARIVKDVRQTGAGWGGTDGGLAGAGFTVINDYGSHVLVACAAADDMVQWLSEKGGGQTGVPPVITTALMAVMERMKFGF